MSGALEPMAVLAGTALLSYCTWQLLFDPVRGPIPGQLLPVVALAVGVIAGLGLMAWGYHRLGVPYPP
ncbi:hypothetical protein [Halorussus sp. AFM4]|uniref:hypothetical protein n=1 Tax=Halorussus sp. AFM4 TaxID=3421651 RepID=UPI003EBF6D26